MTEALAKRERGSLPTDYLELLPTYLIALARYDEAEQVAREILELATERDEAYYSGISLEHLAAIAAERPSKSREYAVANLRIAARVLGFVNARFEQPKSRRKYFHQPGYDRVVNLLRHSLGEAELTQLMAAGSTMSEEDAVVLTGRP